MKKYFLFLFLMLATIAPVNKVEASPAMREFYNQGVFLENECDLDVLKQTVQCSLFNDENNIDLTYTFSNSSNEDINATFALPFTSNYVNEEYGDYKILVDNNVINSNYRYTYGEDFYAQDDINKISNDYKVGKISDETVVYKHTYHIDKNNVVINFFVDENINDKYIFGDFASRYHKYGSNKIIFTVEINYDYNYFDIYFIDKDIDFFSDVKVYSNGNEITSYTISETSKEELTFKDLMFKFYNPKTNISQVDWYNALQDKLKFDNYNISGIDYFNMSYGLNRWIEYSVVIPSNSTVTNELIYPILYSDNYYSVFFNFAFFKGNFKSVQSLDIIIDTPYFIVNSDVEKDNNIYSFHYDNPDDFILDLKLESDSYHYNEHDIGPIVGTIIICLLSIPFVIAVICVCAGMKRNDVMELHSLKMNLFAQVLVSLICFIFAFGLVISITSKVFLIVLLVGLLALGLYEKLKLNHNNIFRLVLSSASLLFVILLFFFEEVTGLVFILNVILLIANMAALGNVNSIKDVDSSKNKKYYMIGALSNKNKNITIIECAVIIVLYVSLIVVFNEYAYIIAPLIILAIITTFITVLLTQIFIGKSDLKDFQEFDKDLDYKKLENNILSKLEDPKINPETVNYYKMLLACKAIGFSLERYEELQKEIFIPHNKTYLMNYDLMKLNFLLPYDELMSKSKELSSKYASNRMVVNKIKEFTNVWKAYYTGEGDIDKLAPYETKNDLENAFNLFVQIHYYEMKNDTSKANELRALFFLKYRCVQVLVDELNGKEIRKKSTESCFCSYCGKKISCEDVFCEYCGRKVKDI